MLEMKKWVLILIIILLISAGVFYWKSSLPANKKVLSATEVPTQSPSPSPSVWPQSILLNIDNSPIRISWAIVDPKKVELYDNLKEQKMSEEIKANKSCSVFVNGGFYSENKTHLGLFIANFETLSKFSQNDTFNGFLSIDSTDKILISADKPGNNPRIALQTGPLLILDDQPLTLTINNDEPERRIIAGTTIDNKLIFLALYREKNDLEGPLLEKLPEIINLFKEQANIKIINAINLDGGSASVFISKYDLLRELNIVGSYFCAK